MNPLLKQVLSEVEKLSEAEQESIAYRILEEIESDREWDDMVARSRRQLRKSARQARAEIAEEGSLPYDPSNRPE